MIALDTNVLVRFLVEDDADHAELAKALLQRAIDSEEPCYVSDVVLCELVWVLERRYKLARNEVCLGLRRLVHAQHLLFSSVESLSRALEAYEKARGDFADYIIREHARANGCVAVATFEKDLLKEPGFMAV